mgnify:FL=1
MRKSFTEWVLTGSSLLNVAQQKNWLQISSAITYQMFFILEDDVALIELKIPSEWAGKSLHTLNLRQNYNVNVIGFRDEKSGKLNTHFDPSKKLPDEGIILVVADNRTLEKFDYLGYLK